MNKDEALKLALKALEMYREYTPDGNGVAEQSITAIKEALALPEQEPVAWNVVDPTGKIVATEMNSVRGWARIEGYKPTVEGLLGFHEQGWRVVPTTPPQRTWVGLTDEQKDAARYRWLRDNKIRPIYRPGHSRIEHYIDGQTIAWSAKDQPYSEAVDAAIDCAIEAAHGIKEST